MARLLLKYNAPINAQTVVCKKCAYVLVRGTEKKPIPKFCMESRSLVRKNQDLRLSRGLRVLKSLG